MVERTVINIDMSALERSITGAIISMIRFVPELDSQLEIIGANVYELTPLLTRDICKTLPKKLQGEDKEIQNRFKEMLISETNYDKKKYSKKRMFTLVIKGENAVETVKKLIGDIRIRNGVSIVGRYGFFKQSTTGEVLIAEFPAFAPNSVGEAEAQIDLLWNKYKSLGGQLKNAIVYPNELVTAVDNSVVMIKPNVFNNPHDPRVGDVIDGISRAGMYIVGAKVIVFSQEQAKEFYKHHSDKPFYDNLVNFMSNKKCLALVYEGVNAINEIRKSALQIIRKAYTDSETENTIHTSEIKEDFLKESKIINFEENRLV